ncbi:MAG: ABC transporter, permease protein 1 (cluster 1, maltose/g3p/polyamine/iron), partial [uncultured Thermomicrobiales bacterium]
GERDLARRCLGPRAEATADLRRDPGGVVVGQPVADRVRRVHGAAVGSVGVFQLHQVRHLDPAGVGRLRQLRPAADRRPLVPDRAPQHVHLRADAGAAGRRYGVGRGAVAEQGASDAGVLPHRLLLALDHARRRQRLPLDPAPQSQRRIDQPLSALLAPAGAAVDGGRDLGQTDDRDVADLAPRRFDDHSPRGPEGRAALALRGGQAGRRRTAAPVQGRHPADDLRRPLLHLDREHDRRDQRLHPGLRDVRQERRTRKLCAVRGHVPLPARVRQRRVPDRLRRRDRLGALLHHRR